MLGVLAVFLLIVAVGAWAEKHDADTELSALQQRIDDAQRENHRLADQLERMRSPQWLALLARQRLNYKQPEESVVFVYKNEKVATLAQPRVAQGASKSNWRLWLEWLQGK